MSEYNNNNRGVLFKNDKKGNDNAPNYKGNITVTAELVGKELDLAAWEQKSAKGVSYMSLTVCEKFVPDNQQAQHNSYGGDEPQEHRTNGFDDSEPPV